MNSYIANARERFLKPSLEHRNKLYGEQIHGNPGLVAEQKKIEAEINNNKMMREANQNEIENAEVAEAIEEAYPEEYYSNYLN